MNGFCGVMSIQFSMRYCLGPAHETGHLWTALALMPFGLLFDFFDGMVARWRGKSSLMGAELDSLADLVSDIKEKFPYEYRELTAIPDLLRCRTLHLCICRGHAHWSRPAFPYLLRSLWSRAPGSLQRHYRQRAQGRQRQGQVLRRTADSHKLVDHGPDGILGIKGLDSGEHSLWHFLDGHGLGIPPCGPSLPGARMLHAVEDTARAEALIGVFGMKFEGKKDEL